MTEDEMSTNINIIDNFVDEISNNEIYSDDEFVVDPSFVLDDDMINPIIARLLNYGTSYGAALQVPYRPIYTEREICDNCCRNFDDVSNDLAKLKRTDRSWRGCPTDVSFRSDNRIVCLHCVLEHHGIRCSGCDKTYLYMDSFFYDDECKSCYIKSKKGCVTCLGFVNRYTGSKLCGACKSEFESLELFTKHLMTDRDIKFYRKKR